MDRGAWWAIVHGVAKESDMTEQTTNIFIILTAVMVEWCIKGKTQHIVFFFLMERNCFIYCKSEP